MASGFDELGSLSTILNFVAVELSLPVRKHVFDFASSNISPKPHHLLTALGFAVDNLNLTSKPNLSSSWEYESLLLCNDEVFRRIFRMSRKTVQLLKSFLVKENLTASANISVDKKILLFLWILGNTQPFKEAALVFSLPEETVLNIFYDMCTTLSSYKSKFIKWPNIKESDNIAKCLEFQFGFPGVVGVIGCMHLPISRSSLRSYEDTNSANCTVTVQVVCDHNFILRDVSSEFSGSMSPADIIVRTPIYKKLKSKENPLIEPHKHILGGSVYPMLPALVTPYLGNNLTAEESKFNTLHSATYALLTQCFNLIKQRFQRLSRLSLESAGKIITACCILHNFCIRNGDYFFL